MNAEKIDLKNRLLSRSLKPIFDRIYSSPLALRLTTGTFWNLFGSVISRVLTLVSFIVVARIVGKESFGELGMIQSTVVMFQTVSGFGLGTAATKYVAELRTAAKERVGHIIPLTELISLVTGGFVALAIFVFAPRISGEILSEPHLTGPLRIGSVSLFFGALYGSQNGALLGLEAFRAIARVNIITGVVSLPLLIGGALSLGVSGAIIALAAIMCINWLISRRAVFNETRNLGIFLKTKGCTKEWKGILGFTFPAVLSSILVTALIWLCNVMLVNQPDGYAEMGIFNAANQWRLAMLFIPNTLGAVALPMLANLHGEQNKEKYKQILKFNIALNSLVAFGASTLVFLCSPMIMRGYGKGYEEGATTLGLLAVSIVFVAFNNVIGQAIISQGRMWLGLFFNFLWGIVLLGSAHLLIPLLGSSGLAWAYVISYLLHTVWQTAFIAKTNKFA
jgi:O-antigen/teichoic acid export membrane protein